MANKIILKKSSVAAKAPVAGDLDFGELAINYTDSKLYFKKADGSIDSFVSGAASAPVTSVGGNIGAITDTQLLTSIKNVDGTGSGLDADFLDGNHASAFYLASNPNGYTSNTGTVTSVGATSPLVSSGGTTPSLSIAAATASVNGYMSAAYASKLDGIAAGATNVTNTNQLTNGAGYITSAALSSYLPLSGGTLNGVTNYSGDNYARFGPNSSWGAYLRVGGNGRVSTTDATVATTNGNLHLDSADGSNIYLNYYANGSIIGPGGNTVLHGGNYSDYAPTKTGGGASGTWGINVTGNAATATNSSQLNGLSKIQLWNNSGQNHSTYQSFGAVPDFGVWFMQAAAAGDSPQSGSQYYIQTQGLGNDYGYSSYALMTAVARDHAVKYTYYRTKEGGAWGSWVKSAAGYADSAGTITSQANSATITASTGVTGNHIVQRDANGYIYASHINFNTSETENATINSFFTSNGDGWSRKASKASVISQLGLLTTSNYNSYSPTLTGTGASGTWSINVTGNAATATSADQIDNWAFRNTGSNSAINADTIESNGITYYTAGVTNFSGNATDGALYSQAYSASWQHQIAGDFRSGQIALRGKNNGTWQAWRTVLDSSNYNTYTPTKTGTGASGTWGINITGSSASTTGNAATATTLQTARTIALTGDIAYTSGSFNGSANVTGTATLATVNANVGSFGSSTTIPVVTVNAKGLVTAVSTATVSGGQYFGTAATKAIAYNANSIGENVTVTTGNNGLSAGPITVNTGFTVTVQSGAVWTVV